MHISFVAWYQSIPWCGGTIVCFLVNCVCSRLKMGSFSVWMTDEKKHTHTVTQASWETHNNTSHTHAHSKLKQNKKTQTFSTASHEVNQCCCEASTQLLAIWAVGFKKKININKKKKNIQAALLQMLGCHDFQNAAGKLPKPNFPFLWHPATVMCCFFLFKSSSSNSIRVLLSSSNYSKALAPAVTPYEHWGRTRLRIFVQ